MHKKGTSGDENYTILLHLRDLNVYANLNILFIFLSHYALILKDYWGIDEGHYRSKWSLFLLKRKRMSRRIGRKKVKRNNSSKTTIVKTH
jgi:hypothetical protein